MNRFKYVLIMFVPLLVLGSLVEIAARILTSNESQLVARGLGARDKTSESDVELGWRLVPNSTDERDGWNIRINGTGQRSPEVGPKEPGEFRILSLGESTTFGAFVPQSATYSARLESLLNAHQDRKVTVINAGVSAYSSFQSLRYLELYGHEFQPDVVLFYHEVNDYLPTAIRQGSWMDEIGLLKTDKELYGSRLYRLNARLLELSYFYAWLSRTIARDRIADLNRSNRENPLSEILLPDIRVGIIDKVEDHGDATGERRRVRSNLRPSAVGQRVSETERLEILEELESWCAKHGAQLVLIHPSYRDSIRHECVLTEFAAEHDVKTFEAYGVLHPDGVDVSEMFRDRFHPTVRGHDALARGLARFLTEHVILGGRSSESN